MYYSLLFDICYCSILTPSLVRFICMHHLFIVIESTNVYLFVCPSTDYYFGFLTFNLNPAYHLTSDIAGTLVKFRNSHWQLFLDDLITNFKNILGFVNVWTNRKKLQKTKTDLELKPHNFIVTKQRGMDRSLQYALNSIYRH